MKGRAGLSVAAAILAIGAGAALGAGSPITIKTKPSVIGDFTHPIKITGALRSGKRGVKLALRSEGFPFRSGFKTVATTRTAKRGRYAFKRRASIVTRFRVLRAARPAVHSRTRTVYRSGHVSHVSCRITGHGVNAACGSPPTLAAGARYTARVAVDLRYPGRVYAAESAERWYVYWGQRNGSPRHPNKLRLVGTVAQKPRPHHGTHLAFSHHFQVPRGAFAFRIIACSRTLERTDGFGPPGLPGSHHCGDRVITYNQANSQELG